MENRITFKAGRFEAAESVKNEVVGLVRKAASENDHRALDVIASAITQPIDKIATYREVFSDALVDHDHEINEDPRYPKFDYALQAFTLAPQGEPQAARIGSKWDRFSVVRIQTGFEVHLDELQTVTWPILEYYMQKAGEELARQRDLLRISAFNTAASSLSNHVQGSSGCLTRTSIDTVLREANRIGQVLDKAVANSADILDMRSFADFTAPIEVIRELNMQGYLGSYGALEWRHSPFVTGRTVGVSGEVFFLGRPENVGYFHHIGGVRPSQEESVRKRVRAFYWDQFVGVTVVNPYAVFKILVNN